jgi:hypothetical protein
MLVYQFLLDDGNWKDLDHKLYLLNASHTDAKRWRIIQVIG